MKNITLIPATLLVIIALATSSCKKQIIEKTVTVTIIDTLDVDRPIGLTVSKGLYGSKISLSWEAMPLAKKYEVWKFNNARQKYLLLGEAAEASLEDMSIEKSLTKIFYKVRSINEKGEFSRFSDADFGYTSAYNYNWISSFGSEGNGADQFDFAKFVAVDKNDNIYVSDEGANRVLKFDTQGKYLSLFYSGSGARAIAFFNNGDYVATRTQGASYVQLFNTNGSILKEWGTYGTGNSNFANIEQVAIDDEDHIWIVDGINDRVKKYDKNGNLLLILGKTGKGNGEFMSPIGVCFFNNKVFVTDVDNKTVQVFDKMGKYIKTWAMQRSYYGIKSDGTSLFVAAVDRVIKTDENGDVQEEIGLKKVSFATDVAIKANGELLVCDVYGRKIHTFKNI